METSSDSDTPIPKKRPGKGNRPMSPQSPSTRSPPPVLTNIPPLRRHRFRQHSSSEDIDKDDTTVQKLEKLKPRLPKPKPRNIRPSTSAKIPSAPPIDDFDDDVNVKSISKAKHRRRRFRENPEKSDEITTISIEQEEFSKKGNESTDLMRIRDILHTFQDDVVTVKSSQRIKWQQKLEEIQSQLLFPEFGQNIKSETVARRDGGGSGSVPSKWQSAAQLIPRDIPPVVSDQRERDEHSFLNFFNILHRMSRYCSGLVTGLLLWQVIFAVSQMMVGSSFTLSSLFWILYWSLTSLLLLITVCGFVIRINMDDESPLLNSLLRFLLCMAIYVTYYVSKALDLQRQECSKYLEVDTEHLNHVHLTYKCDLSVAGKVWQNSNYWKTSLSILPAFGTVTIYTVYHFCPEWTKPT